MKRKARLLEELKEGLTAIYGENLNGVYLYGSYATDEQEAESDIDVVIVLEHYDDYWEEIKRTGSLISNLSLKYDVSISPIRITLRDWRDDDSPFLANVRKDSVPL